MKYFIITFFYLQFNFVYSQKSSDFDFIERPFGKVISFGEESWSADFELDNIVVKELIYKLNAKYDKFENLMELQLNLAKSYDEKIVKCIFGNNGMISTFYFDYENEENKFKSLQTFHYTKLNQLLVTRHYKMPYSGNYADNAVFVNDSNVILGKYILEGYIKFLFNERNIYSSAELVGSFQDDLQPYSIHAVAFRKYFNITTQFLEAKSDNSVYCDESEDVSITIGRVLNKEKIVKKFELEEVRYEYNYDKSGNWIERKMYLCEKPIEIVKRTIAYFE